ncbi:MAG: Rrf2 family transcriptional regulator [bacterium]
MKFSVKLKYGLQAVLELAQRYTSSAVQIKDIAKSQKIPIRYLEQLLLILKRRGVVKSTRGKQGGYALARHPSDITVLDVFEAYEGVLDLCVCNKKTQKDSVVCGVFRDISDCMNKKLADITIEDLVFKKKKNERAYIYNI